ncbi:MAG: hypothetical protein A2X25_10225 [Chloroflexi bacterium GWB2_49_20]|nr:MAG: hypothetical protein A2X25_10225 [Chloroflexi bacterium GWB2_49_20]OGN79207.1 MAG: hypothetical protein A2X26_03795 [Chloroflexi bacterium GWC2_49_37]OGN83023.1 MAG: hypothetical protein A2X27_08900 [Chloroflexi bacterium GWD2_49_16]HCC78684.1 hypothetical protein [Anaerolineae bacterium]
MIEKTFLMYFLVLPISLGVGITLMGAILLLIDSRRRKKYVPVEMYDWETTGGKILAVRLNECPPSENVQKDSQTGLTYQPVVDYAYSANGVEHTGNNLFPGDCDNFSKEDAQAFLDKYPVNSFVPVRYNPSDPSKSALENQPRRTNRVRMIGLLFAWFGISVCCFSSLMIFIMSANIL